MPFEALAGYEVTRLGQRHPAEAVAQMKDPRGRPLYWINAAGAGADAGPGTDFHAIAHNRVSITPLLVDLTRHSAIETLRGWVAEL